VAGILLETGAKGTLLIGMGVNLVSAPAVSILHRASTCLQAWSSARAVTREAYLPVLLAAFSALFSLWKTQGIPAIIAEWLGNSQDVGRPLILRMGQEEIRGVFESLNAEGFLVLRLPDGQSKIVASGEVQ
jgi:BirA family biotin operon repressor/biotin-[acetyl-CoA-carboxylase] ligase